MHQVGKYYFLATSRSRRSNRRLGISQRPFYKEGRQAALSSNKQHQGPPRSNHLTPDQIAI